MKTNSTVQYLISGFYFGLLRQRTYLSKFLAAPVSPNAFAIFHVKQSDGQDVYLGWGYKPSGKHAIQQATKKNTNYLLLEDGFIRSVGLGVDGHPPLSLVTDDLGIYYDTSKSSRLEQLILDKKTLESLLDDARRGIDLVVTNHLSKYNHVLPGWPDHLIVDKNKKQVLVIDQTAGDMALVHGGVTANTFALMIKAAKAENPDAVIWVKIHPDVLAGKKEGHLTDYLSVDGVRVLSENINPISLLEKMDRVYTATSQMGFEALLLGKEVITYGVPWYAGWGLTTDRHPGVIKLQQEGRRATRTLDELFAAAYFKYSRYLNPYSKEQGTLFDVIDYLLMVQRRASLLEGEILCIGLTWWKRQIIKPFLQTHHNQLRFFSSLSDCQRYYQGAETKGQMKLMLWGQKFPEAATWAESVGVPVLRMEDGFIRSVGLGSNLVPPLSLVIDDKGIYFDPRTPSRLECILQSCEFSELDLRRASELIEQLVQKNIAKYNVGSGSFTLPEPRPETVILIPGQVEDDASIRYGSANVKTNLDLIKAVRAENPSAYLVYKPHPDVVSGNRPGVTKDEDARQYVDEIVTQADILACIQAVDEVHTITSLSGFEALLRGKKVTCYGAPFYSGWGLTTDKQPVERRKRELSLEELVAASLIIYPTYINPKRGELIDPLTALKLLDAAKKEAGVKAGARGKAGVSGKVWSDGKAGGPIKTGRLQKKWNQLKGLWQVVRWG